MKNVMTLVEDIQFMDSPFLKRYFTSPPFPHSKLLLKFIEDPTPGN